MLHVHNVIPFIFNPYFAKVAPIQGQWKLEDNLIYKTLKNFSKFTKPSIIHKCICSKKMPLKQMAMLEVES
jgi:hypothetical protein